MSPQIAALLLPAISLLMLAYTNKFLALANLIRTLHAKGDDPSTRMQIDNLMTRISMILNMQFYGVSSLKMGLVSLACSLFKLENTSMITFMISLYLMWRSMEILIEELMISTAALRVLLSDMKGDTLDRTEREEGKSAR